MTAIANLSPATIDVEPGREASATVRIRNGGAIVDRFEATIVGPLAPYARAEPPFLSLFPGQEGEIRVIFSPPRAAQPAAGIYPFGVRIAPAAEPGGATVEEGRITLAPFAAASAEIVPQTSRGSRGARHDVAIENGGNAPFVARLGASDPDRRLAFEVQPAEISVPAGGRATATVRVRASDTFLRGQPQSHPFLVEIRTVAGEPPVDLRPTFLQGPLLPSWVVPAAGLLVALVIAVLALPRLLGTDPGDTADVPTTPPPTLTAAPSTEPPPSESVPPSDEPSGEPSPSDAPSPSNGAGPDVTPTPGPFELVVEGEELTLGGALSLKCPSDDVACRQAALDTTRALLTSLGAPFTGRGIVSTSNTQVLDAVTVPVVLARNAPFPWLAQDGATTDETSRAVLDLAPLLATPPGFAYAVVDSASGPRRFVLPDPLARQLLETIYDPNPVMVDPMPARTLPPFAFEFVQPDLFWAFASPPPAPN